MLYRVQSTAIGQSGLSLRLLPGASITVFDKMGAVASIFSDSAGAVPLANPVIADASAGYDFYVIPDDYYDLSIASSGKTVDERIYPLTPEDVSASIAAAAQTALDRAQTALDVAASSASADAASTDAAAAGGFASASAASAAAAATNAKWFNTIALGLAGVADGATFGVLPNVTDGLTLATYYRRDSVSTYTQITSIAPGSVTRQGNNLYNSAAAGNLVGQRLNPPGGSITTVSGYNTTDHIPVTAGATYRTRGIYSVAWYNAAGTLISASVYAYGTAVTAPALSATLRVCYPTTGTDNTPANFWVVAGSTPVAVESYGTLLEPARLASLAASKLSGRVSPDQTGWQVGKNKFNVATRTAGIYVSVAGQEVVSAGYNTTDYIPVTAGATYYTNVQFRFLAYFDAGKAAISASGATYVGPGSFVIPSGVAYMRGSYAPASDSTLQVELGATGTAFEAYGFDPITALSTGEAVRWPSSSGSTTVRTYSYGIERMREARQRLRSLKQGKTGTTARAHIGLIGDSWTHNTARYALKLATALWATYHGGTAKPIGRGYISFGGKDGAAAGYPNGDVTWNSVVTLTGSWIGTYNTGGGPDICHLSSSTAGDAIEFGGGLNYAASPVLGWTLIARGGAGVVRYQWTSGGAWTTVDLSALGASVQSIAMTGMPGSGTGAWRLEVVSGTPILYGVLEQAAAAGVLVSKLGATGSTASGWTALDAAGIAALGLDAAIVMLGTNDQATRSPAQYKADIEAIVTKLRTGRPTIDILLVAPCENLRGLSVTMQSYADQLYAIALAQDVAFLDLQPAFGSLPPAYGSASARPWFNGDNVHPEPDLGGYAIADAIARAVFDA